MKNLIISTVGTSLITNAASKEEQRQLYEFSNCSTEDCPSELRNLIDSLFNNVVTELQSLDNHTLRRKSAELNGILGFYNEKFSNGANDFHFLISTDTYQGIKSAEVVKDFLETKNIKSQVLTPKGLSTKNKEEFSEGIKQLLKLFDESLPGYKNSSYNIIFNLTGGFKSLQGYLNTIAMFYADKIIYIFESNQSELIQIPRLPIKIDSEPFENYKDKLLLLNANREYTIDEFRNFPEAAIDQIDNKVILSIWGEVIWNKIKYELFDVPPSLPFIEYHKKFIESYKDLIDAKFRVKILETIAKVSVHLEYANGNTSEISKGGIQFSPLESKIIDGKQVYHFRSDLGIRINCIKKDNKLLLTEFGTHDQTQR